MMILWMSYLTGFEMKEDNQEYPFPVIDEKDINKSINEPSNGLFIIVKYKLIGTIRKKMDEGILTTNQSYYRSFIWIGCSMPISK